MLGGQGRPEGGDALFEPVLVKGQKVEIPLHNQDLILCGQ